MSKGESTIKRIDTLIKKERILSISKKMESVYKINRRSTIGASPISALQLRRRSFNIKDKCK
jgi:hypothetical protein